MSTWVLWAWPHGPFVFSFRCKSTIIICILQIKTLKLWHSVQVTSQQEAEIRLEAEDHLTVLFLSTSSLFWRWHILISLSIMPIIVSHDCQGIRCVTISPVLNPLGDTKLGGFKARGYGWQCCFHLAQNGFIPTDCDINHTLVLTEFLTSGLLLLDFESDTVHTFALQPNLEVLQKFHSEWSC